MKTSFRLASLCAASLVFGSFSIVSAQSWVADPVNNELEANPIASVKVAIGTSTPVSKLQVTDGSVLFNGTSGITPISGVGTRLMYVPAKGGAFRVGSVDGGNWDNALIGNISFAQGWETIASGYTSVALNSNTTASGDRSFATGYLSVASGVRSSAMGEAATAQAYLSTAVGSCNVISGTTNLWIATDPIFVIGNGTSTAARSNAVTVLKNGNVGIGTTAPGAYRLSVAGEAFSTVAWSVSDARFKTNITPLTDALDKVMSLQGVSYDFKADDFPELNLPRRKQIGFIAQELEQIIPEVVNTGDNGYKAVAYQHLTALLAEAIKEQQGVINELHTENREMKARLQAIESRLGITSSEGVSITPGTLK